MNIKQTVTRFRYAILVLLGLAMVLSFSAASYSSVSAKQTTWQKFIEKKCGGSSADAAERCANDLSTKLKQKCGAEKHNDAYKACWRKFIRNNGGTAGADSSPFETEVAPETNSEPVADGCAGVETAIIKCTQTNSGSDVSNNGVWALLLIVINILTAGIGIVAVGGIIFASILYASAGDQEAQVKKAKDMIANIVIGIIAFALMYSVLQFLIPGGVF